MGQILDSIGNGISSIVEPVGDAASSVIEPVMDVAEPYVEPAFNMLARAVIGGQIGAAFGGTTPTMDSWSGGDYGGGDYSGGYGGGDGIDYGGGDLEGPVFTAENTDARFASSNGEYNDQVGSDWSAGVPVGVGQTTGSGIPDPYAGSTYAEQAAELQSAYGGAGIPDPYAGSTLTGQAADLMTAYGSNSNNPFSGTLSSIGRFFSTPSNIFGAANTASNLLGRPGSALSVGSGVYGMYQAEQLKKLAQAAALQADPWGTSGGRAVAGGQLQNLLLDPNSITSMPGYKAGLQAVERRMASQGYNGSGNMMAALAQYGGQFYNDAVGRLGGLAGANQNPSTSADILLRGNVAANDASSKAQASIGYGLGGGMNPSVLAALQKIGAMQ